jgi:HTH-type transcriptional regulator, sugar sensing transcriptional regulator
MSTRDAATALASLGFTGLESEIYAFLLSESTVTGYRIAQAIGKPVANTYKAIQTLQLKGAIEVEESSSRLCRAVPSDELLDRLARDFNRKKGEAKDALSQIGHTGSDDRIYSIRSKSHSLQRSLEMISSGKKSIIAIGPSEVFRYLLASLEEAHGRSVGVFLKSDHELATEVLELVTGHSEHELLAKWSYMRLAVDGEQYLGGWLDRTGEDAEMMWTKNPTQALLGYQSVATEWTLTALEQKIEGGAGPKRLAKVLSSVLPAAKTPGAARAGLSVELP